MGITSKEEFDFNDFIKGLNFEDVIDGLNKYFTEDETRVRVPRSIVEIRSHNKILFYRFDAEMYLDKLISWLRTEHGIFYYPGMEAKYAKTERIPPLTERLMDEGALNSLKKLHKRVTGEEPEVDSNTLIADGISHAVSVKDVQIEELKTHVDSLQEDLRKAETKNKELATLKEQNEILKDEVRQLNRKHIEALDRIEKLNAELDDKLSTEIWEVNNKRWNDLHGIHKALGYNGGISGHVDNVAEAIKEIATHIKSERDRYLEQLDKATADYKALCEENQKLKDSLNMGRYGWLYEDADHKSDINELISDYCTKFDITPPSPYFIDKACVEYLFSVVDLERKHRAAVGKQMVDNYEKDLLKFIYKEYADRTRLGDETITYNPQSVRNTITKIISDYARSRTRVEILEGRIKCIFDKYKTKFTVDDYVINGDPTISFMLDCIWSWIGSSAELKQECDFLKDELGKEKVIREFLDRRRKTQTKLETIEKKLEELLKDIKEELP